MQLYRPGTTLASQAPESTFTGDVRISNYHRRAAPSRLVSAATVFAPGSRTPWKRNPFGQTIIVTAGVGWVQGTGEAIREVRAGDTVWFPPGQRHWEGATPTQAMTYVAIHEGSVEFEERVTNEEYGRGLRASDTSATSRRASEPVGPNASERASRRLPDQR